MSIVVCAANRHDVSQTKIVLENIVIKPSEEILEIIQQNLCADAGFVGSNEIMENKNYIPHIRPRGEEIQEKDRNPNYKPRRWIVEVAHSWFTRFRKLYIRYEKKNETYLALHHLAASIIVLRKIGLIYE